MQKVIELVDSVLGADDADDEAYLLVAEQGGLEIGREIARRSLRCWARKEMCALEDVVSLLWDFAAQGLLPVVADEEVIVVLLYLWKHESDALDHDFKNLLYSILITYVGAPYREGESYIDELAAALRPKLDGVRAHVGARR